MPIATSLEQIVPAFHLRVCGILDLHPRRAPAVRLIRALRPLPNNPLETGELRVRQQLQAVGKRLVLQDLKTEKSRRTLALPKVCTDKLLAHRTQQLKERLKAGADWVETGLVFTTFAKRGIGRKVGAPLHPRNILRTLYSLLDAAELPRVRFHDLRHSAASLLIAEGVELVEVSMLLGHSELRVTADLYSHLQKQTAAKAAQYMDELLMNKGL